MRTVIDLNHAQAREYFLREENYCNVDLPKYVTFQNLLSKVDSALDGKPLSSMVYEKNKPEDDENLSYKLLSNKDSNYAWRPFEIINPAIYVDLVHFITEEKNWSCIVQRFKSFKDSRIVCCSIPPVKRYRKTQKGSQILAWWEGMEQESLKLSLSYRYVYDADISNCYGSIYTHSIAWALHDKSDARDDRNKGKLLGSKIDKRFQNMRYRQTNGIPQGNAMSDFVAEIVLGFVDSRITERIKNHKPTIKRTDYKILRYRDDYKVFTNMPELGKTIMRYVSESLAEIGMHLNTAKTHESSDVVLASVKPDKIDELFVHSKEENYAKWLLQIYATTNQHPNSGKVARQLSKFHDRLYERLEKGGKLKKYEDVEVMLGIATNIAITNLKYYAWSVAIISVLLNSMADSRQRTLASKIVKKFDAVPNTGLLDIWLQRVTFPKEPKRKYKETFCSLVTLSKYPGNELIWSTAWLQNPNLKKIINETLIINQEELKSLKTAVDKAETASLNENPSP